MRWGTLACAALLAGLTAGQPRAQATSTATLLLLDQYARGEFGAVVSALQQLKHFDDLLNDLKRDGPAWIDAATPAERPGRALAAATFALEAARAGLGTRWKLVQNFIDAPVVLPPEAGMQPVEHAARPGPMLYWGAPPSLLEWGCAIFRRDSQPRPIERWWQLAAVAVAERSGDFEFLIGNPFDERRNPDGETEHLKHAAARFPTERRFALAQGIALEWRSWPERPRGSPPRNAREAIQVFENLANDESVGAEATLRLGALRLRAGAIDQALTLFDRVDETTRDRYLVYLARYFRGQAFDRQHKPAEAARAYRAALAAIPGAQSASTRLAALLFVNGAQREAGAIIEASLSADPQPVDPWRTYADADDRFWPELIARLRTEIVR